ncbi:MAG: transglutaminase-like domain-containing protein [Desulfobacteraceae bacterium]|jgi:hypothetical protein
MSKNKTKIYLNILGVGIVALWVVMIGLLVKKVHFGGQAEASKPSQTVRPIDSLEREWKEIYLKNRKVGYAVNIVKPFGEGYFIQEEIFLKLDLMGMGGGLYTFTQCRVDKKFLLKSFNLTMNSGVVRSSISGTVENDLLVLRAGKGEHIRVQRIKLKRPPMIGASISQFFKSQKIHVGQTFHLPVFDPSAMAQKDILIKVTGKEALRIHRMTYEAFRLEAEMWGKTITFWLDEDGSTLKEEGFMGLTTIRSSAARAPTDLERKGGIDLYEMVAVVPDRRLPDPGRLGYLKLQLDGMDHSVLNLQALDSERQHLRKGVLEMRREGLPSEILYTIPYDNPTAEMKIFLEPEFNIESDDREIKGKAREISGEDRNPVSVARKMMSWVYHNMDKRPVLAVPSALEALRTGVGDCNEHATLLTALLRASGIPARLSIGLTYTREKFYYHAWTEAYVGAWISMDATLNQMPADVTHIKLIEGNLDRQMEIAGLMGELKLKIVDFRYD